MAPGALALQRQQLRHPGRGRLAGGRLVRPSPPPAVVGPPSDPGRRSESRPVRLGPIVPPTPRPRLGVPRAQCINMYGMTELSSQFYDAGNAVLPSVKRAPHWLRSRVVDPVTGRDMPAGEPGIVSTTLFPTSPPSARLNMAAGPIS